MSLSEDLLEIEQLQLSAASTLKTLCKHHVGKYGRRNFPKTLVKLSKLLIRLCSALRVVAEPVGGKVLIGVGISKEKSKVFQTLELEKLVKNLEDVYISCHKSLFFNKLTEKTVDRLLEKFDKLVHAVALRDFGSKEISGILKSYDGFTTSPRRSLAIVIAAGRNYGRPLH